VLTPRRGAVTGLGAENPMQHLGADWRDGAMAVPPYLHPFILAVEPAQRHRQGNIDVHAAQVPAVVPPPVVVFVHGGPLPVDVEPKPRDWPTFHLPVSTARLDQ
jgi:hypothetical protein